MHTITLSFGVMTLSALAFAVRFPYQPNNLDGWVITTPATPPATPPRQLLETIPETPPETPHALQTGSIERFREEIRQFAYQPEEQAIESSSSSASSSCTMQVETPRRLEDLFTDSEDDSEDDGDDKDENKMTIDNSKMQKIKQPWAFHPRMEYALSLYSDSIVTIDEASSGRKYRCHECLGHIHVVNGSERRKHFRHNRNTACEGSSPESYAHSTAKKRLSEILDNQMKIVVKRVTNLISNPKIPVYSSETLTKEEGETVVLEYRGPNGVWIADLAVLRADGSVKFIVEVLHSNPTENRRPEPWYEVEAEEVLRSTVTSEEGLVLKEKRKWKSEKAVLGLIRSLE